mgnify:FL=1
MFYKHSDDEYHEILPGIRVKTLVYGEKTLMAEFRMQPGAHFTRHSHAHEQTGYLVSGAMRLTLGEQVFEVKPGDSWCVPPNAEHYAESLEQTVMIQIFSPVREDYLAYAVKEIK